MGTKLCKICHTEIKRNYVTHTHGVRHRYAKMLKRWLADETMSFADMSRRLQVSRERIRQLAAQFPRVPVGRQRQKIGAVKRLREKLAHAKSPISRVIRELKARGISWQPVRREDPYVYWRRMIKVGSPPTLACSAQLYGRKPTGYYYIAKAAQKTCDFYLYVGPAGVLVFPYDVRPRGQTTFMLGGKRKAKGIPGARHDWSEYLDAWHLIESRLKNNRQKSK